MKLLERKFFNTEKDDIGHVSIYEKSNGNRYIVYFIEERYHSYREFTSAGELIHGSVCLGFQMLNITREKIWT